MLWILFVLYFIFLFIFSFIPLKYSLIFKYFFKVASLFVFDFISQAWVWFILLETSLIETDLFLDEFWCNSEFDALRVLQNWTIRMISVIIKNIISGFQNITIWWCVKHDKMYKPITILKDGIFDLSNIRYTDKTFVSIFAIFPDTKDLSIHQAESSP